MSQQLPRRSMVHTLFSALTRKAPQQTKQHVQSSQHPAPDDRAAWRTYWKAQGQAWRTEPEIDTKRQQELERCRTITPDLEHGDLAGIHLEHAYLIRTHLEEANLWGGHIERANLIGAYLEGALLGSVILADEDHVGPVVVDIRWSNTNLAIVDWSQVNVLGDEYKVRKTMRDAQVKNRDEWLWQYERAVRANRQLAVALESQGLNEDAARFAYRAQVLQKRVFWFQMLKPSTKIRQRGRMLGTWLFSWFLFLLAGYGYKPERSFLAYLLVISTFTALYLLLDPHLAWYEAVVVSMTAFHGRGFSPSIFSPGDPLSIASAVEAFVGLIIEVTFIATLTRRFFRQ